MNTMLQDVHVHTVQLDVRQGSRIGLRCHRKRFEQQLQDICSSYTDQMNDQTSSRNAYSPIEGSEPPQGLSVGNVIPGEKRKMVNMINEDMKRNKRSGLEPSSVCTYIQCIPI